MFIAFVVLIVSWTFLSESLPVKVFTFRWITDLVAFVIIITLFGILHIPGISTSTHGSTGPSAPIHASTSATLDEENGVKPHNLKSSTSKLNVVSVELKTKSVASKGKHEEDEQIDDPSTPAQRELLALASPNGGRT